MGSGDPPPPTKKKQTLRPDRGASTFGVAPSRDLGNAENMKNRSKSTFYSSRQWRRLAASVLHADNWCDCGAPAAAVHHRQPIDWSAVPASLVANAAPGRASADVWAHLVATQPHAIALANLQPICRQCHEAEHQRSKGSRRSLTPAQLAAKSAAERWYANSTANSAA